MDACVTGTEQKEFQFLCEHINKKKDLDTEAPFVSLVTASTLPWFHIFSTLMCFSVLITANFMAVYLLCAYLLHASACEVLTQDTCQLCKTPQRGY